MRNRISVLGILACALALSACEGTKESLGLTRSAPDEFAVVKRAPLEMPPDYALRPPSPGAPRPQETAPQVAAEAAVFGSPQQSYASAPDEGESVLLQQAGATDANPAIRRQVDIETSKLAPHEKPVAERLLGWTRSGDEPPPATVVDAKAEAERLQKNAEEGKPVTAGETPTVKQ